MSTYCKTVRNNGDIFKNKQTLDIQCLQEYPVNKEFELSKVST